MEVLRRRFCKAEGDDMFMVGHAGQSHGKTILRTGCIGGKNYAGHGVQGICGFSDRACRFVWGEIGVAAGVDDRFGSKIMRKTTPHRVVKRYGQSSTVVCAIENADI